MAGFVLLIAVVTASLLLLTVLLLLTGRTGGLPPLLLRARAGLRAVAAALAGRGGGGGGGGGGGREGGDDLSPMKRADFTLEQLSRYDGVKEPRILLAVNGKVFDVTKGRTFYGKEGPYGAFAGRDASRGLASFRLDTDALRDEYDDLSDLTAVQTESVREWEMQFMEKYSYVGRLLRPGEEAGDYTDEEDVRDNSRDN